MINIEDKIIKEKIDKLFKYYFLQFSKNSELFVEGYNDKMKAAFARGFISGMSAFSSEEQLNLEYNYVKNKGDD